MLTGTRSAVYSASLHTAQRAWLSILGRRATGRHITSSAEVTDTNQGGSE